VKSFRYAFEELPLVISGGYSACDVTGFAEIGYEMTGAWSIQRIGFDGFQRRSVQGVTASARPSLERRVVWLDLGDPVQMIVYDRLEHEWRTRVQNQVDERICDDREDCASDRQADHVTALRRELT
jgi:hypothetical protein